MPARIALNIATTKKSEDQLQVLDFVEAGGAKGRKIGIWCRTRVSLTILPFVIQDSIIYKNIEVAATRRILRILAAMKSKQIFLAFDEAGKFGSEAEELLKRFTAVKLAHDDLLYTNDWRTNK